MGQESRLCKEPSVMTDAADHSKLSHLGPSGEARMVDVSDKPVSEREASASATVRIKPSVLDSLLTGSLPKGDAVATARVAGILAAKRTGEGVPPCPPPPP